MAERIRLGAKEAWPSTRAALKALGFSILIEFMRQKNLDFWLEGQRFGDWRRNPTAVLDVPVPGSVYFKPGFSAVGNQTCYVLPLAETDNNPNFP